MATGVHPRQILVDTQKSSFDVAAAAEIGSNKSMQGRQVEKQGQGPGRTAIPPRSQCIFYTEQDHQVLLLSYIWNNIPIP